MTPEIRMIAVDTLIPYARNARTHNDAQVAQIAALGFNRSMQHDSNYVERDPE